MPACFCKNICKNFITRYLSRLASRESIVVLGVCACARRSAALILAVKVMHWIQCSVVLRVAIAYHQHVFSVPKHLQKCYADVLLFYM